MPCYFLLIYFYLFIFNFAGYREWSFLMVVKHKLLFPHAMLPQAFAARQHENILKTLVQWINNCKYIYRFCMDQNALYTVCYSNLILSWFAIMSTMNCRFFSLKASPPHLTPLRTISTDSSPALLVRLLNRPVPSPPCQIIPLLCSTLQHALPRTDSPVTGLTCSCSSLQPFPWTKMPEWVFYFWPLCCKKRIPLFDFGPFCPFGTFFFLLFDWPVVFLQK